MHENKDDLVSWIAQLEKQLADLEARLPAHSITPSLIEEIDRIDEQLRDAKSRLAANSQDSDQVG